MREPGRLTAAILPVVLALVLAACGGSDAADRTTATAASTTTMAATTTTEARTTTTAAATTTAGDLPTELGGGTYLVGSEIRPGVWAADECGCPWAVVDADGTETLGMGDDAVVPDDAHAMRLGSCTWTFAG